VSAMRTRVKMQQEQRCRLTDDVIGVLQVVPYAVAMVPQKVDVKGELTMEKQMFEEVKMRGVDLLEPMKALFMEVPRYELKSGVFEAFEDRFANVSDEELGKGLTHLVRYIDGHVEEMADAIFNTAKRAAKEESFCIYGTKRYVGYDSSTPVTQVIGVPDSLWEDVGTLTAEFLHASRTQTDMTFPVEQIEGLVANDHERIGAYWIAMDYIFQCLWLFAESRQIAKKVSRLR